MAGSPKLNGDDIARLVNASTELERLFNRDFPPNGDVRAVAENNDQCTRLARAIRDVKLVGAKMRKVEFKAV